MKTTHNTSLNNHSPSLAKKKTNKPLKKPSVGASRERYLLEAERIRNEIGDLEQIRLSLGLSQRRACQLLLVDPSAWTRWNKTGAPPHIYQALKWLLELKKVDPNAAAPRNIESRVDHVQAIAFEKIKDMEGQVAAIERLVSASSILTPQSAAQDMASRDYTYAIEAAVQKAEERFQAKLGILTAIIEKIRGKKKKPARKSGKKKKPVRKPVKNKKSKSKPGKKKQRKPRGKLKPKGKPSGKLNTKKKSAKNKSKAAKKPKRKK